MSKATAWYPRYIGDYHRDTGHLRTIEHGAYVLLLDHYYSTGPLPNDDMRLATIAHLTPDEWREMAETIRAFFTLEEDGHLHQARADAEIEKREKVSRSRAAVGKVGADGKWHGKRDGKPMAIAIEPVDNMAIAINLPSVCQTQPHKKERTEAIASDASASDADLFGSKPPPEPTIWNEGIDRFVALGLSDEKARSMAGRMVKVLGGDQAKALSIVRKCPDTRDPIAWISAALKSETMPAAPTLSDNPDAWAAYADPGEKGWDTDAKGIKHPLCGGYQFDVAASLVGDAAGLRWDVQYDWGTLAGWMREYDLHDHILPILKKRASWSKYTPPERLKFFDGAIRAGSTRKGTA